MERLTQKSTNSTDGARVAVKSSVSVNRININWFGIGGVLRKLLWNARNAAKESKYLLTTIPLRRIFISRISK